MKQLYKKGDLVHINADLGDTMSHFTKDVDAIVLYSYNEKYSGGMDIDVEHNYCLYIKGQGKSSWYYEHQLKLLESNRLDLLEEWQKDDDEKYKMESDLDWIFANGKKVLTNGSHASIQALAKCFGLNNLWGKSGEGVVWYERATFTLTAAEKFLLEGDKDGWLERCKYLKVWVENKLKERK